MTSTPEGSPATHETALSPQKLVAGASSPELPEKPQAELSPEALEASVRISDAIEQGKPVEKRDVDELIDGAKKEFVDGKITLSPKEEKAWKKSAHKAFKKASEEAQQKKIKPEKTRDDVNLDDYAKTVSFLLKQYGLDHTALKLGALEGVFVTQAVINSLLPTILNRVFRVSNLDAELAQRGEFRTKLGLDVTANSGEASLPLPVGGLHAHALNKPDTFKTLPKDIKAASTKFLIRQWAPLLASVSLLPLSLAEQRANSSLANSMLDVRKSINVRIANSLFMRRLEFSDDAGAAEYISQVMRGKEAVITLLYHTYRSMIPGVAAIGTSAIAQVAENPPAGLLNALHGLMIWNFTAPRMKEAMAERHDFSQKRVGIESKISSMLASTELIKTDDAKEAARLLEQELGERDDLLHGRERAISDAEKKRRRISTLFRVTVPAVGSGWNFWRDYKKKQSNASDASATNPRGALSSFANTARVRAEKLVDTVKNRQWSDAAHQASNIVYPFIMSEWGRRVMEGNIATMVGLYDGTIKSCIRDIRQMEEILGPYNELDLPDGPKEQARTPVEDLPHFDISIRDLHYKDILHGVSLDVPEGSFVTLKGKRGLGKTTLMRHILGYYKGDSGEVRFGDQQFDDIKQYGEHAIQTKLGYAPQHPKYFPQMTLRENLALWSSRQLTDGRMKETLHDLGLGDFADKLDTTRLQPSGGELRIIGIARALLKDPHLLFLDEPTAHLDEGSARQIVDVIRKLRKDHPRMTIMAITHDPVFEEFAREEGVGGSIVDFSVLNKEPANGNGEVNGNTSGEKNNGGTEQKGDILQDNQVFEAVAKTEDA